MARRTQARRGVALLMVLILLVVAVILGLSYVSSATLRAACTNNLVVATRARYLAESAVQHALYVLQTNPSSLDTTGATAHGPYYADGSGDAYHFYVCSDVLIHGRYLVTGEAAVGEAIQRSRATVQVGPAPEVTTERAMLIGSGSAWLPLSLSTDGDVHVNGNLINLAHIDGNVSCMGSVTGIRFWITGDIEEGTDPVDPPEFQPSHFAGYALYGLGYSATEVQTNVIHQDDPLTGGGAITPTNPGGVVIVTPASGSVVRLDKKVNFQGTIVVDGDLLLDGQSLELTSVPGFPAIVVTGKVLVNLSTRAEINGVVIAPEGIQTSGLALGSRTTLNGGLIADEFGYDMLLLGTHRLNYDADRARIFDFGGGNSGQYFVEIISWHD